MSWLRFAVLFLLAVASPLSAEETKLIEVPLWDSKRTAAESAAEGTYEQRGTADRWNRWLHGAEDPVLRVHRPATPSGPRAAVVIFPGGGYGGLAIDKEGNYVAEWLAQRGIVGVVVPYRCGGGEHQHPVPLSDAKRAIRLVRQRADDWGIDPNRIGVMGFSAGGHLAASAAVSADWSLEGVEDSLSAVSDQANFAVLVYPVISMREGVSHGGSRENLLGKTPDEGLVQLMSADEQVDESTPPTLLIHSYDDRSVPIDNAKRYADACRKNGVPVEAHFYETGGHGYGMWAAEGSVAGWPAVFERWLDARGFTEATP